MVSAGTVTEMDNTVSALRRELSSAYATAVMTRFGDEASRLAVQGSLRDIGLRIERLDGELREQVYAGTFDFNRWRAIAVVQHEAMVSLVGDVNATEGLWNHIKAFVAETPSTVQEIVDDVKEVAQSAVSVTPYAIVAVGVGLVLYLGFQLFLSYRILKGASA